MESLAFPHITNIYGVIL